MKSLEERIKMLKGRACEFFSDKTIKIIEKNAEKRATYFANNIDLNKMEIQKVNLLTLFNELINSYNRARIDNFKRSQKDKKFKLCFKNSEGSYSIAEFEDPENTFYREGYPNLFYSIRELTSDEIERQAKKNFDKIKKEYQRFAKGV